MFSWSVEKEGVFMRMFLVGYLRSMIRAVEGLINFCERANVVVVVLDGFCCVFLLLLSAISARTFRRLLVIFNKIPRGQSVINWEELNKWKGAMVVQEAADGLF